MADQKLVKALQNLFGARHPANDPQLVASLGDLRGIIAAADAGMFGTRVLYRFKVGRSSVVGVQHNDLWPLVSAYAFYPSSAIACEVVSTSADDGVAGTGARSVRIEYLDENRYLQEHVAVLNGITPVALPSMYRVNEVQCLEVGSSGMNVGGITVRAVVGGTIAAVIPASKGRTQQAIFFVPCNYFAVFLGGHVSAGKGNDAHVEALYRPRPDYSWAVLVEQDIYEDQVALDGNVLGTALPGSEARLSVASENPNARVTGDFAILLIRAD